MLVKTLVNFIDLKENVNRVAGDEFTVTQKRFEEINATKFGVLIEEVKEVKRTKKTVTKEEVKEDK